MEITLHNLKEKVVVRQNYQGVAGLGKSSWTQIQTWKLDKLVIPGGSIIPSLIKSSQSFRLILNLLDKPPAQIEPAEDDLDIDRAISLGFFKTASKLETGNKTLPGLHFYIFRQFFLQKRCHDPRYLALVRPLDTRLVVLYFLTFLTVFSVRNILRGVYSDVALTEAVLWPGAQHCL